MINRLLSRSAELERKLSAFLELAPFDESERFMASRIMCSVAFEHAESVKMLVSGGNLTSATALVRLQYEAFVRAMWLLYAASDSDVAKLTSELTQETVDKANKLPMLSEMLEKLQGKAPPEPIEMLLEFKEYSWKPLNSFVHGGIHAIHRHSKGYPVRLLEQVVRISNGVSVMAGMLLVILHGGGEHLGKLPLIQREFSDCLPDPKT